MYLCVTWAAQANPCRCFVGLATPAFCVVDVCCWFLAQMAGWMGS